MTQFAEKQPKVYGVVRGLLGHGDGRLAVRVAAETATAGQAVGLTSECEQKRRRKS